MHSTRVACNGSYRNNVVIQGQTIQLCCKLNQVSLFLKLQVCCRNAVTAMLFWEQ